MCSYYIFILIFCPKSCIFTFLVIFEQHTLIDKIKTNVMRRALLQPKSARTSAKKIRPTHIEPPNALKIENSQLSILENLSNRSGIRAANNQKPTRSRRSSIKRATGKLISVSENDILQKIDISEIDLSGKKTPKIPKKETQNSSTYPLDTPKPSIN